MAVTMDPEAPRADQGAPQFLPPLRQELSLQPAPAGHDGSPAWTLHDPSANRFYQIGWPAFEILSRWQLGEVQAVVASVNAQTTLHVDAEDVVALAQFLVMHELTQAATAQDTERLRQVAAQRKLSPAMWLLKNYLFIRIPLVRPMPFLRRVYPWIAFVYRPSFWWAMLGVTLLGLYLVSRQWDSFVHTFRAYGTWQGLLGLGVALSFAKVLHEMGHAFTAYRHGCRVPSMGMALLVMWPVLYTDTNEAWKLSSRRARLQIGAAGVLSELLLASFATLLWSFLPDGPLRAGVFMLATSTWLVTLAINASPFTRFDGYFLLSDWLNVPNLHERTFALGRWWLREQLFGFGDPPPEEWPPRRRWFLVTLAMVTWLYRFVLFLSIALLVFHVFFRALGIVMMGVEIGWFLALPIVRELRVWWHRRGELRWRRQTRRTTMIAGVLAMVLLVPWQSAVRAPAVLGQAQAQTVYTPRAVQLATLAAHDGERVHAGQLLAQLRSPDLDYQLQQAELETARLQWQVQQQPFDETLRDLGPALRKRLDSVRATQAGLRAEQERLALRAPFDGRVTDLELALRAGEWLAGGEALMGVVGGRGVKGEAFVGEADLARLADGQDVRFVATLPEQGAIDCKVDGIDRLNLAAIDAPYVASVFGGPVSSVARRDGTLIPLESTFRVRFDQCESHDGLARELSGRVVIAGQAQSLVGRGLRWLGAIVRREASF